MHDIYILFTVNKSAQSSWQISSELCKSNHHAYLYGDVNLTDVTSACQRIEGQVTGPAWLGIAKEKYISFHEGNFNNEMLILSQDVFFNSNWFYYCYCKKIFKNMNMFTTKTKFCQLRFPWLFWL